VRFFRALSTPVIATLATACSSPNTPGAPALPRRGTTDTISFEAIEGTRLAFDLSPDGRHIIIDLLGQLWRVPSAGGEAVPITNAVRDTAEDFDPAVSPDGRRIAFTSDRPAGRGLWVLSTDGGVPRRLTTRDVGYFSYLAPAWAPDGRRLAYSIADTLVVIDVERGTETPLRIDSVPSGGPLPGFTARNASPAWSSDGTRLTFVRAAGSANRGEGPIYEVSATGGMARSVTTTRGVAPAWSPDGSRLAFLARDSVNRWQVYVQPRSGEARRLTSHDEVVAHRVRWMPDGQGVVYAADGGLWRIGADGGTPVAIPFRARVTMPRRRAALAPVRFTPPGEERVAKGFAAIALSPDAHRVAMIALDSLWVGEVESPLRAIAPALEAGDRALAWSPDGIDVAWTRRAGPGRPFDLVATNTRTGALRVVAALRQDVLTPVWSPDGRWLAFAAGPQLRLVEARRSPVERIDETRDLGNATVAFGALAWSPGSDALVASTFDFNTRRTTAEWIPLQGERRPIGRFPQAAADLHLSADGQATWVEGNLLWRARFDGPMGLRDAPVSLSADPAVEARHATDGSVLFLSADGLRLRAPNGSMRSIPWPLRYRAAAPPPPLLIRGVRVIDGRGAQPTEPRDVLIERGRIARMGAAGTVRPDGARVMDAAGAWLIPGLIDLHAHIWDDLSLSAWLHNGVTTVRDIASQKLKTPDTRNTIAAGAREGPRVVFGGAMFHRAGAAYSTLTDQVGTDSGTLARAVAIMAGMDAGYLKERGFDRWWSAVHLVDEAHRHGLTVSGHCEHILPVVAAGVDGAEHVLDCFRDRYTMRSDYAGLARAAGLWIVPTAALRFSMLRAIEDSSLVASPDVAPFLVPAYRPLYASDSVARRSAPGHASAVKRLEISLRRYAEAGVTVATGTDSPFPLGVQHEMQVLVEAGFTPMQALVAATSGAARVLNAPEIGTIAEGQWADLVLLDANPLEDIRNARRIRDVIQGGRIIDRERLRRAGMK